jgi:hypothetical protein
MKGLRLFFSLRNSILRSRLGLFCFAAFQVSLAGGADEPLFDFQKPFDIQSVAVSGAQALRRQMEPAGLQVRTGHTNEWPGISLKAPTGHWALSRYAAITLVLRNTGTNPVTVNCRVDNPGADGTDHCVTGSLPLSPGQTGMLRVPLTRASDDTLDGQMFGMRGYPVRLGGKGTVDPENITGLVVFVSKPSIDHEFQIEAITATGTYQAPTASVTDASPFLPFIDTLGQYRHKTWPGKTASVAQLQLQRELETTDLSEHPGPNDWDQYGGWKAGPHLNGTGFFRTEKVGGKWWLVDPEGHLFFSQGIDCVRSLDSTPVAEREGWYEDFPGKDPLFGEFLSREYALKGHYAGKTVACFSFLGANLRRKYGPDWAQVYPRVIHRRLRSWGLNTIANWSDEATFLLRQTPYTDTVSSDRARMIEGSEGYWGKFPDVYDASFGEALRRSMEAKRGKSAGDAWCLGYFSDNEMSWGDEISLSLAALKSPPSQPAKQALVAQLKETYQAIDRLNAVWGTAHASWDSLLASREAPEVPKARPDLVSFYTRSAERYFETVRSAIHSVAPNQLYLGCRFAWVNAHAAAAAAKFCDVVSYNLYQRDVSKFKFNGGADVPLIIGEFHLGALDRGLFHTGLVPVASQAERAAAYREYVLGALRHPQLVGCHWFQYADEPVTGRVYDEENYQIGFIDVADTPYRETIEASRAVGTEMYRTRAGH